MKLCCRQFVPRDMSGNEDRIEQLQAELLKQSGELRTMHTELREKEKRAETVQEEAQKALAQKDLEIQQLKEGSGSSADLRMKTLELESRDATIQALKAKHKLVQKELKECKEKGVVEGGEDDDEDTVRSAVDIGQRKHAQLKNNSRLCLVMWKAPKQMHAVHFNLFRQFVKGCSSVMVDDGEEEDGEGRTRKRRRPTNKEWLGLLELEAPFVFEEVEGLLKTLGQNDLLVGPVFLQSEMQVWKKGKGGAYQTGRMPARLSTLRGINVDDNFNRQSKQIISDFIVSQKDRHFSSDDSWMYMTKVMD
jgi:hypothetical protein